MSEGLGLLKVEWACNSRRPCTLTAGGRFKLAQNPHPQEVDKPLVIDIIELSSQAQRLCAHITMYIPSKLVVVMFLLWSKEWKDMKYS